VVLADLLLLVVPELSVALVVPEVYLTLVV
jgi:hypothetical protein